METLKELKNSKNVTRISNKKKYSVKHNTLIVLAIVKQLNIIYATVSARQDFLQRDNLESEAESSYKSTFQ